MESSANGSYPKPTEDGQLHKVDNGNLQKPLQKNQSFLKKIDNFRKSKRNQKLSEEKEPNSPEKLEPQLGKDQNARSSKRSIKRQSCVDEPGSPDKVEGFGSLVSRLSKKSPNKLEKKEEPSSPESKGPEETSSLVDKLRRSVRAKKKVDYNGAEKNATSEEPKREDKEEPQMLSVMEINGLIQSQELIKAFENVKLMEDKLLEECGANDFHENVTEFTIRGRDVDLLYGSLFNMMRSIVKDSLGQDQVDEPLICSVLSVIKKEAEAHKNPIKTPVNSEIPLLGQPRGWKKLWKEAVKDSVSKRVESLPLKDEEKGWLMTHLETLKSTTMEDLKKVKNSLRALYPEEYDVCGTYVRSYQDALTSHLQKNLLPAASEFSQLYGLLDWIMNQYESDKFMGNPELHKEINPFSLRPLLEGEGLEKLKKDYNRTLQETIRTYLNNIIEMEKKNWENGEEVEKLILTDSCHLPIYTDIEEIIGTHVRNSATLCEELEISASNACIEELGTFTTRLQAAFQDGVGTSFTDLFVQYTVVYVNSLTKLRHNTTQSDAEQCRCAEINLNNAIKSLKQNFIQLFKKDTKPQFHKIITKNWLMKNTAFNAIMKSTGILCRCLKYLLPPHDKDFAHEIHQYLVTEYISQTMKRKLSLNHSERKKAAQKMNEEAGLINKAADDMGSHLDNLHRAIHCISEIIGAKKKDDIKAKLEQLFRLYPDVSKDHILCLLHLHGVRNSSSLLAHFQKLQEGQQQNLSLQDNQQPRIFSGIDCTPQVACFVCF
ncbi:exocyst complex component 3-like protein 4 isoform X1 [Phyllobates terribilis]|uniref:exocyst complex component 3-like protein 4 isoform X1 n=1 Tax=Phyllobates terribilis TaxID=111132 RepID=UPI003CCB0C22